MFKMSTSPAALFVVGLMGLACGNQSSLNPGGGTGGAGGTTKGGQIGGGAGGGSGGTIGASGGAAGATVGAGGIGTVGSGGAGGSWIGSDGCYQGKCVLLVPACPGVFQVNPDSPCGCLMCVPTPDAGQAGGGVAGSSGASGGATGATVGTGGTATAGSGGAGASSIGSDGCYQGKCALLLPACQGEFRVNPDSPCGCLMCVPTPDAGTATDARGDAPPASCTGLDECTCLATSACSPIAEACWCPFPQCNPSAACFCGGGRFIGCAPQGISTCAEAKTRVAALCPTLSGPTFDGLCARTSPECVTKCLAEVNSCSDLSCTFCEACDCAGDHFSACYGQCVIALGH